MAIMLRSAIMLPLLLLAACKGQAPVPAAAESTPSTDTPNAAETANAPSGAQLAWQRCKAGVDADYTHQRYQDEGQAGYDALLQERCGAAVYNAPLAEIAGVAPVQVVRSPPWNSRFRSLLGNNFKAFVDGLELASPTVAEGDWVTGSGVNRLAPDAGRSAFAINRASGQVLAVYHYTATSPHGSAPGYSTYGFTIADDGSVDVAMPAAFEGWLQDTIYAGAN